MSLYKERSATAINTKHSDKAYGAFMCIHGKVRHRFVHACSGKPCMYLNAFKYTQRVPAYEII